MILKLTNEQLAEIQNALFKHISDLEAEMVRGLKLNALAREERDQARAELTLMTAQRDLLQKQLAQTQLQLLKVKP